jgi:putative membrane protein
MSYFHTFLKGIAMGAADVVPGVSGGTIAFITGIYDKLLDSIRRVNPRLIGLIRQQGLKSAFNHINGFFLLSLFGGIFCSILSLAKLISWLLVNQPIPVWSFFFGLILVSVIHIAKQVERKTISSLIFLLLGIAFAYTITILQPLQLQPTYINIFISGAIAICAMILPGISGSFILLLLGMYGAILDAVKTLQFDTLIIFICGCLVGILSFSHLLSWLLKKHRDTTLITLTGLMIGTLPKVWPWKETLTWRTNSHGEQVPLLEQNLSPFQFESVTSHPAQLTLAITLMLAAFILVLGLEKFAEKKQ